VVANNHLLNLAAAIDQQAKLSVGFKGQFRQGTRQIGCDKSLGRQTSSVQSLQPFGVTGGQTGRVTVYFSD
jgi:hypothetical protein